MSAINPIKPFTKGTDSVSSGKSKPSGAPRSEKNFKKIVKEVGADPDEELVDGELEQETKTPSLFDISKSPKKPMMATTKAVIPQYPLPDEGEIQTDLEALLADNQTEKPLAKPMPSPLVKPMPNPLVKPMPNPLVKLMPNPLVKPMKGQQEEPLQPPLNQDQSAEPMVKSQTNQPKVMKDQPAVTPDKQKGGDNLSLSEAGREATAMNSIKRNRNGSLSVDDSTPTVVPKKQKSTVTKTHKDFGEEHIDLSALNANRPNTDITFSEKPQMEDEPTAQSTMRELAARIIEKIQTMRTEGKTDTIVTLRHPPLLEGASMTLSALDGAKREFNISFTNLTNEAKMFLDRKLSEDNLTQILERKGIIVNALRTTTLPELPLATDTDNRFDRDQQRDQQQERKRQNQTFDAEDTA